jgi:membrane fusion protein, multidrug efflux system
MLLVLRRRRPYTTPHEAARVPVPGGLHMNQIRFSLLMVIVLLGLFGCGKKRAKPVVAPVPVTTARAVLKSLPLAVEAMGSVESCNSLEIVPRISGQILKYHFREGEDVQLDSLLVTIDPAPYAEALRQAEALLASDAAALEFRKSEAVRFAELDTNAVTRSDFERAHAEAGAQEHKVKADRAVVEQARLNLGYCSIHSPITGRSGAYLLKQGSVVEANKTTLLVINQIEPIYVTFSVPEKHLTAIRSAQHKTPLTVEARVPGADTQPRLGRLTFIDNTVDPASGMIRLKGTFANADAFLWPGQYVRVTLIVGEESGVVVTPASAVQAGPKGALVFVVKDNKTVEARMVQVARLAGKEAVLAQGVSPGEIVVTDGQTKLKNGSVVVIAEPAASATTNAVPGAG